MGIKVEFNPDLALREFSEFVSGNREKEECVPEILEVSKEYHFLKKGQRNYYLLRDELVPLVTTVGNQKISKPLAGIYILEVTHFEKEGEIYSRGKYVVKEIY